MLMKDMIRCFFTKNQEKIWNEMHQMHLDFKPITLSDICEKTGFAYIYVVKHLNYLIVGGYVKKISRGLYIPLIK